MKGMRMSWACIIRWAALLAISAAVVACGNGGPVKTGATSLEGARREVPFRIRVPAATALPESLMPVPVVRIDRVHIPEPAAGPDYIVVDIYYRYRPGADPTPSVGTYPVRIMEAQNPGDEVEVFAMPSGGQHTQIDGRPVILSQRPNLLDTEIIWVQDGVAFVLVSTLPWDDTVRIFRSMAEDLTPGGGTPSPVAPADAGAQLKAPQSPPP
jgi:hypothetical protein